MMTVRDHMKMAGYDPAKAWNASRLLDFESNYGTMECERIQLKTFRCRPDCYTEMIGVEATAIVPFTDGYEHPYPQGWPQSLEASVTAYFSIEEGREARWLEGTRRSSLLR